MTPEQQLQKLLTEAEQVTAKMREALAKMETPAQWTPKKGDWAEVISVDISDINAVIKVGDVVQIDDNSISCPLCLLKNGNKRSFYKNQLRHLPDYQPKPKLATTYEEVVEAVKPEWICACDGEIFETDYNLYQLPTKNAAKQDRAFIQIKNLEAYCAERYEGERKYTVFISTNGELEACMFPFDFIKVTREAAEWLIANHPEPFFVFFGV